VNTHTVIDVDGIKKLVLRPSLFLNLA